MFWIKVTHLDADALKTSAAPPSLKLSSQKVLTNLVFDDIVPYMKRPFHIRNDVGVPDRPEASGAVLNALAIIDSFDADHPSQTLSGICRRLGIAKASAFRNLAALEMGGFVTRTPGTNAYSLGVKIVELSQRFLQQNPILGVARPVLAELAAITGETAHLGIMDGNEVVYVEIAESPQRVRALVNPGDRLPAHAVASGKAILAYSSDEEVEAFLDHNLAPLTERTLQAGEALREQLASTRSRGFAVAVGEWLDDVVAVAAPIFSHLDQVVAAIGIAAPRSRFDAEDLTAMGPKIRGFADRVSLGLGWLNSDSANTPNDDRR